jgi:tRNA threonylcarbamoyladenosine biosynthesis protein TsaE
MEQHIKFTAPSQQKTEQFAESLGSQLRGGELIELVGDIGAGKTTFVRGLARGMGSTDRVSSPTFTVSNVYDSGTVSLHHYDFYRIEDTAIMKSELDEVIHDDKNAAVLEWAGAVNNVLPEDRIIIRMRVTGDDSRELDCIVPASYKHISIKQ